MDVPPNQLQLAARTIGGGTKNQTAHSFHRHNIDSDSTRVTFRPRSSGLSGCTRLGEMATFAQRVVPVSKFESTLAGTSILQWCSTFLLTVPFTAFSQSGHLQVVCLQTSEGVKVAVKQYSLQGLSASGYESVRHRRILPEFCPVPVDAAHYATCTSYNRFHSPECDHL